MAINLAAKYEKKVQERFTLGSLTDRYCGHDYTFDGVDTIKIYKIDTVATTDYTRSGTNRFGSLTELGDTVQSMQLTKDRSFAFTIDKGNAAQQFNIKQANACLKREIDEVITPEIDTYRMAKWVNGNGLSAGFSVLSANDGVLDKDDILEAIFVAGATMSDYKVPKVGRTLFIPELKFVQFKLSDVVTGSSDTLTTENVRRGYRGQIDGMDVVTVPSSIFPANINFFIKLKGATVDAMQLKDYRVHKDPPGISGDLVEGRYIYDSFVLDTKAKGIYVSTTTNP